MKKHCDAAQVMYCAIAEEYKNISRKEVYKNSTERKKDWTLSVASAH